MAVSIDGDGGITGIATVNVTGGIQVGTGATINGSTNTIIASTNGSERLRITSTGNVGIGTDNPISELSVHNTADTSVRITCSGTGSGDHTLLRMQIGGNTASNYIYFGDVDDSNQGQIRYRHSDDNMLFNTLGAERLGIRSDGDISITDGNLVVASGHGISFAATDDGSGTMSAELLDDYEEGTWTPSIKFGAGNTGMTFGYGPTGNYTKIGNTVRIRFGFRFSNKGSSTGGIVVSGLPFSGEHSGYNHSGSTVIVLEATSNATMTMFVTNSTDLNGRIDTTVNASATNTYFTNNTSVFGTVVYDTTS